MEDKQPITYQKLALNIWRHPEVSIDCGYFFIKSTKVVAYSDITNAAAIKRSGGDWIKSTTCKTTYSNMLLIFKELEAGRHHPTDHKVYPFNYTR